MKVILLTALFISLASAGTIPPNEEDLVETECKTTCHKLVGLFMKLPKPEEYVVFSLFTQQNQDEPDTIKFEDDATLKKSHFNKNHPTRIIIHGYRGNGKSEVNNLIRTEYIKNGNFNIIIVDWEKGAKPNAYLCPKSRVNEVGTYVGKFIVWLNEKSNKQIISKTSIIGHSLGAHVAGFAGKHIIKNRVKLQTIIGLDPANACFSFENDALRLAATDAEYVEVIHTAKWPLGFHKTIGDADFYPNWGAQQPGCEIIEKVDQYSFFMYIPRVKWLFGRCSHSKAFEYFAESINNSTRFNSTKCASYEEIDKKNCTPQDKNKHRMGGEPPNYGKTGIYYCDSANSLFAHMFWICTAVLLIFQNQEYLFNKLY